jgi:hypothetical protein
MITAVLSGNASPDLEQVLGELLRNSLVRNAVFLQSSGTPFSRLRCETRVCNGPLSGETWNPLLAGSAAR